VTAPPVDSSSNLVDDPGFRWGRCPGRTTGLPRS